LSAAALCNNTIGFSPSIFSKGLISNNKFETITYLVSVPILEVVSDELHLYYMQKNAFPMGYIYKK
jgi:hypothetical protein